MRSSLRPEDVWRPVFYPVGFANISSPSSLILCVCVCCCCCCFCCCCRRWCCCRAPIYCCWLFGFVVNMVVVMCLWLSGCVLRLAVVICCFGLAFEGPEVRGHCRLRALSQVWPMTQHCIIMTRISTRSNPIA
ncbi:unnamed protein product [Polarella glacialis]|uniref:Uncharacterized protein n=1 Tax=Polarella glacialis TaxID=89957 RepID=A0A813HTY2_POLGL|nr:unnamed protein product [Polarella glacialis]